MIDFYGRQKQRAPSQQLATDSAPSEGGMSARSQILRDKIEETRLKIKNEQKSSRNMEKIIEEINERSKLGIGDGKSLMLARRRYKD